MTLIKFKKRDPSKIFENFLNDDFFDELLHRPLSALNVGHYGKVNVVENDSDYTIEVSLPGTIKADVSIEVLEGCMIIQSVAETTDEKNYLRQEFSATSFKRSFTLPDDIKDDVDATFKDGILYVKLEKTAPEVVEAPETKKVEIK